MAWQGRKPPGSDLKYFGGPVGWVTGALTLASVGAALSGDKSLSENLGWAAFGVGIAGIAVSLLSRSGNSEEQARESLPGYMSEAGVSIDESFPTQRYNEIVNGLDELFQTDIGKQILHDIYENTQGVLISPGEEMGSTSRIPGISAEQQITVNPTKAYGYGRAQFARALSFPADEAAVVLNSGIGKAKIMAWSLGHEFGHAVYGYADHQQNPSGLPLNLIRIENPLRMQLGINVMRVHYKGTLVIP